MHIDQALSILNEKTQPPQLRLDALLVIVEQFDAAWFAKLESLLADEHEHNDVRSAVALALGKIAEKNRKLTQPFEILKRYTTDSQKTVRNYVMQALGKTDQEAAAPLLIAALKDTSNTVFASASEALGELGQKAQPYLVDLLTTGAEDARSVAAWQLGELGSAASVPALVTAIRQEKNVSVIALCIWALGEIGMGSDDVFEILTQARKEPEPDVRLRAETAIKKIVRHSN